MIERLCERCSRAFLRKPSDLGRFCSRVCSYASRGPDAKPRKRRSDRGPLSAVWVGGKSVRGGYVVFNEGNKPEHVAIVELAIGHALPDGAVVHHVNRIRNDNRNTNLLALQSSADHNELHRKMRVQAAGGNPWTEFLCTRCGKPKDRSMFYKEQSTGKCIDCSRVYSKERQRLKRNTA